MRTITFYTHHNEEREYPARYTTYSGTRRAIDLGIRDVHTTQIALISFDLLEHFTNIYLDVNGELYELGLGDTNTWTDKNLRIEHNLLKIVTAHFLTDL